MDNDTKKIKNYIIAIDGPCATGKSSLAKQIARALNITYIDTGAMYRAAGLYFYQRNIELNEENIKKYIDDIDVDIFYVNDVMKVTLNDNDVSDVIRSSIISKYASDVSKYRLIREKLVSLQRKMGKNKSVVLDGRDIGTVVFPNANLKIYLSATDEIRAKRRQKDLEKKGEIMSFEEVMEDMKQRDYNDTHRAESPLRKADDAILVDTTNLSKKETTEYILSIINERKGL